MHRFEDRLTQVLQRIRDAAAAVGRNADDITLLGVSKKQNAEKIDAFYRAGLRHIGENYLQEALEKQQQLSLPEAQWHFIGPIQSNKTRAIAESFAWVHTVDRIKIAERLNAQRPEHLWPMNICLQVNIDNEASKSGVAVADLKALADTVKNLPNLRLRGLMVIPRPRQEGGEPRASFALTRRKLAELQAESGLCCDTLSMGMSDDLEEAIAEGATIVRIGSALFGERDKNAN